MWLVDKNLKQTSLKRKGLFICSDQEGVITIPATKMTDKRPPLKMKTVENE